jgi:hypothetical protein
MVLKFRPLVEAKEWKSSQTPPLYPNKLQCSVTEHFVRYILKEILHPHNLNQFYNKYSIFLSIFFFASSKVVQDGWPVSVYLQRVIVSKILTFETSEVVGIVPFVSVHNFSM